MDANTATTLQLAITSIGVAFGVYITYRMRKMDKKVEDIHTFTNSILGKKLRDYATVTEEKAELTDLPEDKVVAATAEVDAAAHELTQAKIDAKEKLG